MEQNGTWSSSFLLLSPGRCGWNMWEKCTLQKKGLTEKVNKAKTESDTRVFQSLFTCRCVFLLPPLRAQT